MSSQRLARQAYTKRWKRAQREMKRVEKAVLAEIRAEQEAALQRQRQVLQRLAQLDAAQPHRQQEQELMLKQEAAQPCLQQQPPSSTASQPDQAHDWQTTKNLNFARPCTPQYTCPNPVQGHSTPQVPRPVYATNTTPWQSPIHLAQDLPQAMQQNLMVASRLDRMERMLGTHLPSILRKLDALEMAFLSYTGNPTPAVPQEEVLTSPCRTVGELEELDRSLAQPETKHKMQEFLGTLGGSNVGSAIRRILRQVATNDVLAQYSLRGRSAKKAFQQLNLCRITTAACRKNFPDQKVAQIEDCIGQVLKFAPRRWPADKEGGPPGPATN